MSGSVAEAFAGDSTLHGTTLDAEKSRIIREGLEAYRNHAGCYASSLIDPSGAILIQDGALQGVSLDTLAVLATASMGATQMMAQHLGDPSYGGICHQGKECCIYLAPLTRGFILMALYPSGTDVTGIRQSLVKVVRRLDQLLSP